MFSPGPTSLRLSIQGSFCRSLSASRPRWTSLSRSRTCEASGCACAGRSGRRLGLRDHPVTDPSPLSFSWACAPSLFRSMFLALSTTPLIFSCACAPSLSRFKSFALSVTLSTSPWMSCSSFAVARMRPKLIPCSALPLESQGMNVNASTTSGNRHDRLDHPAQRFLELLAC